MRNRLLGLSNARDHLAAMSNAREQALGAADQVHPVVRGKVAVT
jgi:hypothetical protein